MCCVSTCLLLFIHNYIHDQRTCNNTVNISLFYFLLFIVLLRYWSHVSSVSGSYLNSCFSV